MSRRPQTMRMLRIPALLGCAAALVLSGCGAGPGAQTAQQLAAVNGANDEVGPIALRDAALAYPGGKNVFGYQAGEDAALGVTIVNTSDTPDELVSVTAPAAGDVTVQGPTTIAGGNSVASAGIGANPTSSATTDQSQGGQLRIVLTDLQVPLRPGLNTPVTFRFREAGDVTLPVPINAPLGVSPSGADAARRTGGG
ncbi:MAG: copper chaperone PCu(A)C [Pseudonocardiaceae bacterium]|nr:copper chaperone PCu(A)C [Pseudonocardiaceae bacterium]